MTGPPLHKRKRDRGERLLQPAVGLEAEFTLIVDGAAAPPEEIFGSPRNFIRGPLMHRTGRSFHLPNGSAIYFDTGVIEIATAPAEIDRGCFARLARALWDSIDLVRTDLDEWERTHRRAARLQGFSTHYNISLSAFAHLRSRAPRLNRLALALAHVLPAPVMLLATNVASTGVGVRPRPGRIEVTADFSPEPLRTAATGALIGGIVSEVAAWANPSRAALARSGVPLLNGFAPIRHTSRTGWLARAECYPTNPFAGDPDAIAWHTTKGPMSLRQMARATADVFGARIRRFADPSSYRLIRRVVSGREPSWLGGERPPAYDDVGRRRGVPDALRRLQHARYERVIQNAVASRPLVIGGEQAVPERVRGWSRVQFRGVESGASIELTFDDLVPRLREWEGREEP